MFDIDKDTFKLIDILQKGEEKYHLFTTEKDFSVEANFQKSINNNYILTFTLQPEENANIDIDYFFQRPFILANQGLKIFVQNTETKSVSQGIKKDSPCKFSIEVKAFKADVDDSLWLDSKQTAYFKYLEDDFKPYRSGIRFDLTTKENSNVFFNAVQLKVDNVNLIFYHENIDEKFGYFIFRPNGLIDHKKFQHIVNSIITALGFISGYYMQDSVYYFSQKEINGLRPLTFRYENINHSFNTNAPIIDGGHYQDVPIENHQLSSNQFNNLVNLFYKSEEYSRSANLLINAGKLNGCSKASLGVVALETITGKLKDVSFSGQIIEDKSVSRSLLYQLKKTVKAFSDRIDKEKIRIFTNKIDQLNNIPNSNKLEDSFQKLDITLDEEDRYCISCRNKFLHGKLPRKDNNTWVTEDELLNIVANRVVMLSSMLLLRMADYKGKVIDRGMTEVIKLRMIRNCQKVPNGNILRNVVENKENDK